METFGRELERTLQVQPCKLSASHSVSANPVSERCHDSLRDVNTAEITCLVQLERISVEIYHNKDNDLFQLHSNQQSITASTFYFHSLC
jgi:hypothetical protein